MLKYESRFEGGKYVVAVYEGKTLVDLVVRAALWDAITAAKVAYGPMKEKKPKPKQSK